MGKLIDLTGQKFGRLTVLTRKGKTKSGNAKWLCQCECGKETIVSSIELKSGDTRSCGCLREEVSAARMTTHGKAKTKAFRVWMSMKARCLNKDDRAYCYYGKRGITICEQWMAFENFYADMGDRPEGLTIERIDNNKGYSPDNCKWITQKEQMRNTRRNKIIRYGGKKQCIGEWAEDLGLNYKTLWKRLKHHPPQIAFNM